MLNQFCVPPPRRTQRSASRQKQGRPSTNGIVRPRRACTLRAGVRYGRTAVGQGRILLPANRNLRYRAGDIDAAWNAYHSGVRAAKEPKDHEMLIENIHGTSGALRHLGRLAEAMEAAQRERALAAGCQHPSHLSRAYSQGCAALRRYGAVGAVAGVLAANAGTRPQPSRSRR